MNKDYIVKKSNYFIMNSSYDLSLQEQKLILTLASMVQPQDAEFKAYNFKINEFMKLLEVDDKSKYTEIPQITKKLMQKVFEIQEGDKLIQTAWLSSAIYQKGTGMVTLKFSPDLKPYMLQLSKLFTQYKLVNILSMKSKYSIRLYEILKANEFKKQDYIEIEVEDLRRLVKAENIYPRYNDFKRFVILQAQKELKKVSDISFEFKEIKTGRKVTSIRFFIKPNKKSNAEDNEIALDKYNIKKQNVVEDPEEEKINIVKESIKIIEKVDITTLEAKKILAAAGGDIIKITDKIDIIKKTNKEIRNLVGLLISALEKDYKQPKQIKGSKGSTSTFNDYEQRNYDFDALEKKLLGWDSSSESEEEFNMADFISS